MTYLVEIHGSWPFSNGVVYRRQLNWRQADGNWRVLHGLFWRCAGGSRLFRVGLGVDVLEASSSSLRPRLYSSTSVSTGVTGDYRYCSQKAFLLLGHRLCNYIGYRLICPLACQSGRGWLITGLFDRYMSSPSRNHYHPLDAVRVMLFSMGVCCLVYW